MGWWSCCILFHEVLWNAVWETYPWPVLTFAQKVFCVQPIPPCLKHTAYNECPSVQWLLKVNDFMEFIMSLNSKIGVTKERGNWLALLKSLTYGNETLWSIFSLHCIVLLLPGKGRNIFFLVLGLSLGLLSFQAFQSIQ